MKPSTVPVPSTLARRPRQGGLVVPFFVADPPKGKPFDFRVQDAHKRALCVHYGHCDICGEHVKGPLWFIIDPLGYFNRSHSHAGSHRECLDYARAVCPFLLLPERMWREQGIDDRARKSLALVEGKSRLFVQMSAKKQSLNRYLVDGQQVQVVETSLPQASIWYEITDEGTQRLPHAEGLAAGRAYYERRTAELRAEVGA